MITTCCRQLAVLAEFTQNVQSYPAVSINAYTGLAFFRSSRLACGALRLFMNLPAIRD